MDRLVSMSILVAVSEAGSLSAAAEHLGTPLTTVSRKVADLERHLQAQLLTRSSRRVMLTEAGRSYVEACKRILEEVVEAERIAKGEYAIAMGELRVTAPIVLGRLHLLPVLAEFLQGYSGIDARLTLADRVVNLMEEGIDAALRVGQLPDSTLIATRIGEVRRVFAASPNYFDGRGMPLQPADLAGCDCIGVEGFTGASFWGLAGGPEPPFRHRLIVNSTDAACEAARAGLGVVSVFSHHVAAALRDGSLVLVLPDVRREVLPVSLVRSSSGYLPAKLRAFLDFVTPRLRSRLAAGHDLDTYGAQHDGCANS